MWSREPRAHCSMVLLLRAATRCGNVAAGVVWGRAAAGVQAVEALADWVPLAVALDEVLARAINLEAVRQTGKASQGKVQEARAVAHRCTPRLGQLWMAAAPAAAEACLTFAPLRSCETVSSRIIEPAKAVVCIT